MTHRFENITPISKPISRSGEIATTVTLITLALMLVGTFIGTGGLTKTVNLLSQAQPTRGGCGASCSSNANCLRVDPGQGMALGCDLSIGKCVSARGGARCEAPSLGKCDAQCTSNEQCNATDPNKKDAQGQPIKLWCNTIPNSPGYRTCQNQNPNAGPNEKCPAGIGSPGQPPTPGAGAPTYNSCGEGVRFASRSHSCAVGFKVCVDPIIDRITIRNLEGSGSFVIDATGPKADRDSGNTGGRINPVGHQVWKTNPADPSDNIVVRHGGSSAGGSVAKPGENASDLIVEIFSGRALGFTTSDRYVYYFTTNLPAWWIAGNAYEIILDSHVLNRVTGRSTYGSQSQTTNSCHTGTTPTATPSPSTTRTPNRCTYYAETFVRECLRQDASGRCVQSRAMTDYDLNATINKGDYGTANNKQQIKFGDRPMINHPFPSLNTIIDRSIPGETNNGSRAADITTAFIGGDGTGTDGLGYRKTGEYANPIKIYLNKTNRTGTPDFGWRIVGQFCQSFTLLDGCGATGTTMTRSFNIPAPARPELINGVKVQCGTDVRYGWYVVKGGGPSVTPSPGPQACSFRALTYLKNADTGQYISDFDERGNGNARGLYGTANNRQIGIFGARPMFNHPFATDDGVVNSSLTGRMLIGPTQNMRFPTGDGYNDPDGVGPRGEFANINLFLDSNKDGKIDGGWEIVQHECTSNTHEDGCGTSLSGQPLKTFTRNASSVTDPRVITNIKVACNTDVDYGWVLKKTGSDDDPVVSVTPSPTPGQEPNPTSGGGGGDGEKRSHQLDLGRFEGNSYQEDLCYASADTSGAENRNRQGDHCRYSVSWNDEHNNPEEIVIEYTASVARRLRWQLNSCNGKLLSELPDHNCTDFVAADFHSAEVPAGKTLRCVWRDPKSNDHINCTVQDGTSQPQPTPPAGGPPGGASITPSPQPTAGAGVSITPGPRPTTRPIRPTCELPTNQGGRAGRCDSQCNSNEQTFGSFSCPTDARKCCEPQSNQLPACPSGSVCSGDALVDSNRCINENKQTVNCCPLGQSIQDGKCVETAPARVVFVLDNSENGGITNFDLAFYCDNQADNCVNTTAEYRSINVAGQGKVVEKLNVVTAGKDVLKGQKVIIDIKSLTRRTVLRTFTGQCGVGSRPTIEGGKETTIVVSRSSNSSSNLLKCRVVSSHDINTSVAQADVDNNNIINALDAAVCLAEWGNTNGEPSPNLRCDSNNDGKTNSRDMSQIIGLLGYTVQ